MFGHSDIFDDRQCASNEMIKFNSFLWSTIIIIIIIGIEWSSSFGLWWTRYREHTKTHNTHTCAQEINIIFNVEGKSETQDTKQTKYDRIENSGQTGC